jgi:class 3 adenylate cyclase/pimeloyl-ACP methyl ester carboxylesterase
VGYMGRCRAACARSRSVRAERLAHHRSGGLVALYRIRWRWHEPNADRADPERCQHSLGTRRSRIIAHMEREVRYCTGADGVRIAYCVAGEGPAHVVMQDPGASHVQLEWSHPTIGPLLASLSEHNTVVRFDPRGVGLSDRVLPSTASEWLRDLESVVKRLALKEFALTAAHSACRPAIAYAAGHPGQVRRLVLIDGFARGRDVLERPAVRAIYAAGVNDYDMAMEAISSLVYGAGRTESAANGAYLRACADRDWGDPRLNRSPTKLDVSSLIDQVAAPTLVLHHKASRVYTAEMSRDLAARILDARLVEVDGLWGDDIEGFAARVVAFVNDSDHIKAAGRIDAPSAVPHGTAVILFADIVDSTGLTERIGDTAFRAQARDLDAAMRLAIRDCGGTPVEGKLLGDGVLGVFTSAREAIDAAVRCAAAGDAGGLPLHLGLHAGDVIREEGNVFGGAVNIASRISGLSAPGEVLVSDIVRGLARTSAGVAFEDRGERPLKGVADPVRVFAVRRGMA